MRIHLVEIVIFPLSFPDKTVAGAHEQTPIPR